MTWEFANGDDDYTADIRAKYAARTEAYDALVAAVAAKADEFRNQGNHYFADQVSGLLDAHLKEHR